VNATTRSTLLDFFAETSFLSAGNASYVELLAEQPA
jgi:hypothetical protein